MNIRRHSIAVTILAALALGLLIPLSLGLVYSLGVERSRVEAELRLHHQNIVDSLANGVRDALLAFAPNEAENAARVMLQDPLVQEIKIHSSIYGMYLTNMAKGSNLVGKDLRVLGKKVFANGEELGYVEIAIDHGHLLTILSKERGKLLLLFSLMLASGLALVIPVLYFRLLRPVARLTRQAEILSSGRLDASFEWAGEDELSRLGRTFEDMRRKLLSSFSRIQELAVRDYLTGLPNRRAFFAEAGKRHELSLRYGRPLSLAMIDIDHFKRVNDLKGHASGDLALREFASLMTSMVRKTDILARLGGEEFVLCMPETGLSDALKAAEKIRVEVENHQFTHGLDITASFGVAELATAQSLDALLEHADLALYEAKRRGRNRVAVFAPTRDGLARNARQDA